MKFKICHFKQTVLHRQQLTAASVRIVINRRRNQHPQACQTMLSNVIQITARVERSESV